MANARSIETHVARKINAAAAAAGRPAPRIVAGLPVAVHDDVGEARADRGERCSRTTACCPTTAASSTSAARPGPGDAAIVGDEASVTAQIEALFDAGATDVWAAPFPVGEDRSASRARTRALLKELAATS